jgi:GMP reductase
MILNYEDILLRHGKSIAKHRATDCDSSAELGGRIFDVPVVAANMPSVMNRKIAKLFDKNNWFYIFPRVAGPDSVTKFVRYTSYNKFNIVSISVGVKQEWIDAIKFLRKYNYKVDYFNVDVALSFNDNVLPVLEVIKEYYPDAFVILGNGCTAEWAEWCSGLESKGLVNCIQVGIGVSAACKTRQYTGFGSSTLGSLIECKKAASPTLKIMSDGGLTITPDDDVCIGDIAKALIVGKADWVMTGAAFARCKDVPAAKTGYNGNASSHSKGHNFHVEGTSVQIKKKERLSVQEQMYLIRDSLRSSISYSGGRNIEEMRKSAKWETTRN